MIIAYYSRTGNVRDFLRWHMSDFPLRDIRYWNADEPYVLVTPTYDFGKVPEEVRKWLNTKSDLVFPEDNSFEGLPIINAELMRGVAGSGNRNFGKELYCGAAYRLREKYDVPIVGTFELKGNDKVAEELADKIRNIDEERAI